MSDGPITPEPGSSSRRAAGVVVGLLVAIAVGQWHAQPPAPLPADSAQTEFSAVRAAELLRELSSEPHSVGTEAHTRAADWVERQLLALGLEVQTQETVAVFETAPVAARVRNVIGRMPGSDSTATVLLLAHYDSVPHSPGAGDDGAGVVALLETARALRAGPPLRNDVVFLIADAEEIGLFGARAFVAEHPLAADVGVVMNFEGRGSGGAVTMFETGPDSGDLIPVLRASASHPIANSLSYEVYRRLPNDTDLSVFKAAGRRGLNFAFIGDYAHYHSAVDSFDALDLGSLQHHGAYALPLTRALGEMDLTGSTPATERVYFDLPGIGLVHYPVRWAWPLAGLTLLLLAGLTLRAARAGATPWRGLLLGAVVVILVPALSLAFAWAAGRVLTAYNQQSDWMIPAHPYNAGSAALAVLLASALGGALAAIPARARRHLLAAWVVVLWALGGLLVAAVMTVPGASYLVQWPLVLALVALQIRLRETDTRVVEAAGLALALPAVMVLVPLAPFLIEALGLPMAIVGAVPIALLVLLLLPQVALLLRPSLPALPAALTALMVIVGAWHLGTDGWSVQHPKQTTLVLLADHDAGRARWASIDPAPDAWSAAVLGEQPRRESVAEFAVWGTAEVWTSAAVAPTLPPPEIELQRVEVVDGAYEVELLARSPREGGQLDLRVADADAVSELWIEGRSTPTRGGLLLRFHAPPPTGVRLRLRTASRRLELVAIDRSIGFPAGIGPGPRPPESIPRRFVATDMTLVRRTVLFELGVE